MALSNSYIFKQNRDELIKDALVSAKIIRDDEVPTGTMNSSAARMLMRMLKAWSVHGLQLWVHRDAVLFLDSGVHEYNVPSANSRWVLSSSLAETTLTEDLAATATEIKVTSSAGMSVGDVIGVVTTNTTVHWSTIDSVDSGTQITITSGLDVAATSGNYVAAYPETAPKPYRITEARAVRYADVTTYSPVRIISKEEFFRLPRPYSSGGINYVLFIPNVSDSSITVDNSPDGDAHRLILHAHFPFDNVDSSDDDFSFPDYWYDAIHTNLTYRLYLDYFKIQPDDRYANEARLLRDRADKSLQEATDFDVEDTYIQFEPEAQWLREH